MRSLVRYLQRIDSRISYFSVNLSLPFFARFPNRRPSVVLLKENTTRKHAIKAQSYHLYGI